MCEIVPCIYYYSGSHLVGLAPCSSPEMRVEGGRVTLLRSLLAERLGVERVAIRCATVEREAA